jgi:hypothetical protein
MNYKASRFKSQSFLHHRPHSNFLARELDKNPIDRSLEYLRKIVEFKRLKEEISSMPSRESYHSLNGCSFSEANKTFDILLQPKIEDLEVIGYSGFVCRNCLTAHPLPIYKGKFNPVRNPIQTTHRCNMERMAELQHHKVDKENVLFDLYRNQLPLVMLSSVRKWTANQTRLKAVEVSVTVDDRNLITVSDTKLWVTRAIRERVTPLTDEELKDFISIVKDRTYAYFRIQDNEMNQNSRKVYFVHIVAGH